MTPEDAAEERVEEDAEEEEVAFRLDELDAARASASSDKLSRVDLRDGAGMLLQRRRRDDRGGAMVKDEGLACGICV